MFYAHIGRSVMTNRREGYKTVKDAQNAIKASIAAQYRTMATVPAKGTKLAVTDMWGKVVWTTTI